jgi:uncharacterized protein YbcI
VDGKVAAMAAPTEQHSGGEQSAEISRRCVQLLRDYTGRGPTKVRTTIDPHLVTVLMRDTLLKGEQSLVNAGDKQIVLDVRQRFQQAMRKDLTGLVEDVTGKEVAAFMSNNHVDPDVAVEIFVMKPEDGSDS